ncbi:MAG: hypothetical protein D3910_20480 [Candidatus Electrothrix sp. ATG2]|nr:hypothetical protein [Candidatus Electrothrix sp. ATG2]
MKILIGITQDLDAAENAVQAKFKDPGTATDVGPFKSKKQAEEWMRFIRNRRDNYEVIEGQEDVPQNGTWFGFTYKVSTVH